MDTVEVRIGDVVVTTTMEVWLAFRTAASLVVDTGDMFALLGDEIDPAVLRRVRTFSGELFLAAPPRQVPPSSSPALNPR